MLRFRQGTTLEITFESREVRTPHSKVFRNHIVVISSRALGEMLDKHNETYTFLRATGAVEHRAEDGVLLALSINGKHFMDRLVDPAPVRPGAVSASRRRAAKALTVQSRSAQAR